VLVDLVAHSRDRAFRHDVAVVHEDHAVGEEVDLVEDVTGEHDVTSFVGELPEQRDRLGAGHRVQPVQRLVEHDDLGVVGDRLGQSDPLPHPLAVSRDARTAASVKPTRAIAPLGALAALGFGQAVELQRGVHELVARSARAGTSRTACSSRPCGRALRGGRPGAANRDASPRRAQQPVMRFISVVFPSRWAPRGW
jgi:hypothetical protein